MYSLVGTSSYLYPKKGVIWMKLYLYDYLDKILFE